MEPTNRGHPIAHDTALKYTRVHTNTGVHVYMYICIIDMGLMC